MRWPCVKKAERAIFARLHGSFTRGLERIVHVHIGEAAKADHREQSEDDVERGEFEAK